MSKRKKYSGPKYVARNPMVTFFGGMSGEHADHLRVLRIHNHMAMSNLSKGAGTYDDFDRIRGAVNMALVMCEMGIGPEFREDVLAGREALLAIGKRFLKHGKFMLKGDELQALNVVMDDHDAQCTNIRAMDIDRAANEVIRRERHKINSISITEAACAA